MSQNASFPVPAPEVDRRSLGLGASVALVLGNIVGIGIFLTPATVARASPNLWVYVGFWLVGGLVAVAGAMVYAELGSMFPRAGGEYVFLDKAYGRPVAYAWGWLSAAITFPGSIAALFVWTTGALASSLLGAWLALPVFSVWSFTLSWGDLFAVFMVWLTTAVNCRSVLLTSWVQLIFTWTPIAVFILAGFWSLAVGGAAVGSIVGGVAPASPNLGDFSTAFCAVFFAYSGWNVLVYIGGEVKKPGRTIPIAISTALAIAMAIYLLLNAAFLSVNPLSEIGQIKHVGVSTAQRLFGVDGANVFAIVMLMAVMACMNVTTMAGSRVSLAMARDGYLWKRMAATHPTRGTPVAALLVQATLASLLVLTGSADFLVTLTGSVMLLLSCVTVSSLFVFRERLGVQAPYRSVAYPWLPALFILVGLTVVGALVASNAQQIWIGLAIFIGLMILYWISSYRRSRRLLRT